MATPEESRWFVSFYEKGYGDQVSSSEVDPGTGYARVDFQLPIPYVYEDSSGEEIEGEIERTVSAWYNPDTGEVGCAFPMSEISDTGYLQKPVGIPRELSAYFRDASPEWRAWRRWYFDTPEEILLKKPNVSLLEFFQNDFRRWAFVNGLDPRVSPGKDAFGMLAPWVDNEGTIWLGWVNTLTALNSYFESRLPEPLRGNLEQDPDSKEAVKVQWGSFVEATLESAVVSLRDNGGRILDYIEWFDKSRRYDLALRLRLLGLADADETFLGQGIEETDWYQEHFGEEPVDALRGKVGELPDKLTLESDDWPYDWALSSASTLKDVQIMQKRYVEESGEERGVLLLNARLPLTYYQEGDGETAVATEEAFTMGYGRYAERGEDGFIVELLIHGVTDAETIKQNSAIVGNWDEFVREWDQYCQENHLDCTVANGNSEYGLVVFSHSPVAGRSVILKKKLEDITLVVKINLNQEHWQSLGWQRSDYMNGLVGKLQQLYPYAEAFVSSFIAEHPEE